MAARDGGQVDVRFSVANAEVVRQALSMLGKDGEKALKQFDAAAKPIPKSTGLISQGLAEAQAKAQEFAARLGPVGAGLASLGPAGLVAGAALGAIVIGMAKVAEQSLLLANRAGQLRDFGETVGLTVPQVQALVVVGGEVGVAAEKVESGIGKMVVSLEELRKGTGKAHDELRRYAPSLLDQLMRTRDTAESIEILSRAWNKLDTAQRAAVSRALSGRDLGMVRIFNELAQNGGNLDQLVQRLGRSITFTQGFATRVDELSDSLARLKNENWERFWTLGAEGSLRHAKEVQEDLAVIIGWLERASKIDIGQSVLDFLDRVRRSGGLIGMAATAVGGMGRPAGKLGDFGVGASVDVPLPRARPRELSPEAQLAAMREQIQLLGQAATPAEQLKLKMLELAVATNNFTINQDAAMRGRDAFKRAQEQAAVAARQQIGILTEEELVRSRLRDLDDAEAKGYIRNAEERLKAEQILRREIDETMKQLEVRASRFQALTRFAQDAGDLDKQLDTLSVGSLNNMTSALTDIAMGTRSASDAFKNLALQVTRSVIEMVIRMQIALPIARALQSALGSFGGVGAFGGGGVGDQGPTLAMLNATGNVFGPSGMVRFASGGVVTRPTVFPFARGMGLMGEAGPEAIMPLRRGRQGRLGVEMVGGGAPVFNLTIEDHSGSKPQVEQQRNSSGGMDARVIIGNEMRREFAQGGFDRSLMRFGGTPQAIRR